MEGEHTVSTKNRWARGIQPRNFTWIMKGQLAVCERPGGYARNHRRVRRQEEIIWIREERFSRIVSLLPSPHNLHAYEDYGVPYSHIPIADDADYAEVLPDLYKQLKSWIDNQEKLVMHHEELGDQMAGIVAGYLLWSDMLPTATKAITVVEQLLATQMGPEGREIVTAIDTAGNG